jgi:hypothetical protein
MDRAQHLALAAYLLNMGDGEEIEGGWPEEEGHGEELFTGLPREALRMQMAADRASGCHNE